MAEENEKQEETSEETPAAEASEQAPEAAEEAASEAPAADPEPAAEELSPKQRRKLARSRADGSPGPSRSAEQRASERAERRRKASAERGRHRKRLRDRRDGAGTGTPPTERPPGTRKVRQGTVVSSAAAKTITVRIERARRDPSYEKVVRRSSTVHAHDERDEANDGDVVRVVETRPLSRTKRWRLVEIVERAR